MRQVLQEPTEVTQARARPDARVWLFSTAMFASAALLFCVQPIVAKRLVPLLGGSPNVWNTCMVFFQAVLLGGYGYAHLSSSRLTTRTQAFLHVVLLVAAALTLPIELPARLAASVPRVDSPIGWLILALGAFVGLPFFALSGSGPLLQRWFADSSAADARDPYFLYAASNLGSMVGLLGYPLLIEPRLTSREQGIGWGIGYAVLVMLVAACVATTLRGRVTSSETIDAAPEPDRESPWKRRLYWLLLAFVPSSLLYGVTTFLSTDIAAVPLLWVLPLSIYLLTFTLVFARRPPIPHWLMVRLLPAIVVIWATVIFFRATEPMLLLIVLHLLLLFAAAMVCHGQLARSRPPARELTRFYLWMSLGGVLGGLFNTMLAPLVFTSTTEYPLAVLAACLLLPRPPGRRDPRALTLDLLMPLLVGALTLGIVMAFSALELRGSPQALAFTVAPAAMLCMMSARRPVRFALGIAAIVLTGEIAAAGNRMVLHAERDFFGVLRVARDSSGSYHELLHGSTLHGAQDLRADRRRLPPSYYTRGGPAGAIFNVVLQRRTPANLAVVGLGVGSLATYARAGDRMVFYEINPAIERIARDPSLFTFLSETRSAEISVVLGDARLRLADAPPAAYDLLVMDAFSSDAIPVHLLTREAVALYESKLREDGLLAIHISNRYLELQPLVAGLAADAGLAAFACDDLDVSDAEKKAGKQKSRWVVLARSEAHLGNIPDAPCWWKLRPVPSVLWTDDYSNVLAVFKGF
jgi:hypothetical protein